MSDGNNFMMIGLHKLAAGRGDGLIPELLALYKQRSVAASDEVPVASAGNDNVIPFRPYLQARQRR
jgi:hypothetical protein